MRLLAAVCAAVISIGAGCPDTLAQSADSEEALLVTSARVAIESGQFRRAARLLDRALRVNPRRIDTYVLRASVYAVRKQHGGAVALMRRARKLAPENPDVLAALGGLLVLAGKRAEGVAILERVVRRWPRNYQAHVSLGHHFVGRRMWRRAIAALEAYFRSRPRQLASADATHRVALANAYLRANDPRRAEQHFRRVLRTKRRNVLARLGLAWSVAASDCDKAMTLLGGLSDLLSRHPSVLLVQGRCALELGRVGNALMIGKRYAARRPADAAGHALLAAVFDRKGEHGAALVALQRAVKQAPNRADYVIGLARLERLTGVASSAVVRLRALRPPRKWRRLWTLELGESLLASKQFLAARALLQPWVRDNPAVPHGRLLLGAALLELGQADRAVSHLTRAAFGQHAIRARGLLRRTHMQIARTAIKANRFRRAETNLVAAAALGSDGEANRLLGLARLLDKRPGSAVAPLRVAVKVRARDTFAHLLLGRALRLTSQHDGARAVLRRAVAMAAKREPRKVDLIIELAAVDLAANDAGAAIASLSVAINRSAGARARKRLGDARYNAVRSASTAWMLRGAHRRAIAALRRLEPGLAKNGKRLIAVRCDIALAATAARLPGLAIPRLRQLMRSKARCPFAAPADAQAPAILMAWNRGMMPGRARRSLRALERLRRRATGVATTLARAAARDLAVRAAAEAYDRGRLGRARTFLLAAARVDQKSVEVRHNQAVLMIAANRHDAAIAVLKRVASRIPEAWVNLGIVYDAKGDPKRALEHYRRAYRAGVRMKGTLKRWISAKERLWGIQ